MPAFELRLDARGVVSGAAQAVPAIDRVTRATEGADDALTRVAKTAAGAFAGFKLTQQIKESTLAAGRYETLGIVMEQAGKNAGYSAMQMHGFEAALVSNGIAMTESRQTMSKLAAANVDLAKASGLARAAQDLAVVGGINSSEAFERMTHGLVSAQPEILRTLGLNVSFEQSYAKMAKTLDTTTDKLSETQKMQIRTNAILEASAKYAGIYELSLESAFKKLGSLPRYFQDISVLGGELGLPTLGLAVDAITEKAKEARTQLMAMAESGELAQMGNNIAAGLNAAAGAADNILAPLGLLIIAKKVLASETAKAVAGEYAYQAALAKTAGASTGAIAGATALARLRTAGVGVVTMLGGPLGVAFTAASFAAYSFYDSVTSRNAEVEEARKYLEALGKEAENTGTKLGRTSAKLSLERQKQQLEELAAAAKTAQEDLGRTLGSFADVTGFTVLSDESEQLTRLLGEVKTGVSDLDIALSEIDSMESIFGKTDEIKKAKDAILVYYAATLKQAEAQEKLKAAQAKVTKEFQEHVQNTYLASLSTEQFTGELESLYGAVKQLQGAGDINIGVNVSKIDTGKLTEAIDEKKWGSFYNTLSEGNRAFAQAAQKTGASQSEIMDTIKGGETALTPLLQENNREYNTRAKTAKAAGDSLSFLAKVQDDINQMMGGGTSAQEKLAKGLRDIAKEGREAGLSLGKIAELQGQYTQAFDVQSLRESKNMLADIDAEIASLNGNTEKAKAIGYAKTIDEWKLKLSQTTISAGEAAQKIAELEQAQAKSKRYEDLKATADFYKEFAELSGQYGIAEKYTNQVLNERVEIIKRLGVPEDIRAQWLELQRLQGSRDPIDGMKLASMQYFNESTDLAKQLGGTLTSAFQGAGDAFAQFALTGKASFSDLMNSILSDLARIMSNQALGNLVGGLMGMLGGGSGGSLFSGSATGGSSGFNFGGSGGLFGMEFAKGGVVSGGLSNYYGISSKPVVFNDGMGKAYAKGGVTSIAREAGPELIAPVERLGNGKYGMNVSGLSGGAAVQNNITIVQPEGFTAKTDERQNESGGVDMKVTFNRMTAGAMNQYGSPAHQAMRGANRPPTRRA